jgi:tetratricopeptide (TPR) repeat protein
MDGEKRGVIQKIGFFIFHYTVIICISIILPLLINSYYMYPVVFSPYDELKHTIEQDLKTSFFYINNFTIKLLYIICQRYFFPALPGPVIEAYITLYLTIPFYVIYFICYTITGDYIRRKFKEKFLLHFFIITGLIYGTFIFLHSLSLTDSHSVFSLNDCLKYIIPPFENYPFLFVVPFTVPSIIFYKKLTHPMTKKLLKYVVLIIWIYGSTCFIYIIYRLLISRLTDVIILFVPMFIFFLFFALYRVFLLTWKRKDAEIIEFIIFIIISLLTIMTFSFLSHKLTSMARHEKLLIEENRNEQKIECIDNALNIEFISNRDIVYIDLWSHIGNKGYLLARDGKYEESIKFYNKAFKNSPETGWIITGNFLAGNGKYDDAIRHYNKAIEINTDCIRAYLRKGEILVKQGKYDEAIRCYDSALNIKPYYISILLDKGEILIKQGRYNEAIKCYDNALDITPQCLQAWGEKGNILFSHGKYEEAIKCYDNAIELHKNYNEWNCNFFSISDDEYDEIIKNREEALKIIRGKNKDYNSKSETFLVIRFSLYRSPLYKF